MEEAKNTAVTHDVEDVARLRAHYRDPHPTVVAKTRPRIDPKAAELIAAAPFFVLATTSSAGADASPRGGPPGFVAVLDEHRIAFGDLAGNNRLDSYTNLVQDPRVGLLFLVPGLGETLRVNGRAHVTTDPKVLERTRFDGTKPNVAVVVDVDECFIHCAKALRRSGLWEPETWGRADERPSGAEVIVDQFGLEIDPAVVEAGLEEDYAATIWTAGGQ